MFPAGDCQSEIIANMADSPATAAPAGPPARGAAAPAAAGQRPPVVAALVRAGEVRDAIERALPASPRPQISLVDTLDQAALHALRGDVVIIDIDCKNAHEMAALAEFASERTSAPVIVLGDPYLGVAEMRELMRIGVSDVLQPPIESAELAAAIARAAEKRPAVAAEPQGQQGRVAVFLAAHGGVGATSLAVHGACALAHRRNPPSICVLDLNVQFGCAALLLDAEQRNSVIDLIQAGDRLDGAFLRQCMARPHGRFDLLGSPTEVQAIENVDPEAIARTIAIARREYDVTIIDLPLLWANWTHAAMRAADVIALIVQLTVPSLRQGRRQLDMLRQEELDDIPVVVVANRAQTGFFSSAGVPLKAATTALGRKVDIVVPESPEMHAAAEAGQPISGRAIEKKLVEMMEMVMQAGQPASALTQAGD
jgi:pilus assembly protein CpaE